MATPLIMAIDQGSTGTKVICLDTNGNIVAKANVPIKTISNRDGWVEHDPIQIWDSVKDCFLLIKEKVNTNLIKAIGITNQRETTVIWDKTTGKPVYNAISWQCRRSKEICNRYNDNSLKIYIKNNTGSPLDAYYSATKIVWLFENVPNLRNKAAKGELLFGTIDSWLIWKLTEGKMHVTDASNASRTLLFNVNNEQWDSYLLDKFNIPKNILPSVRSSNDYFGDACNPKDFFEKSIPILACLGDQQSSLFGQGCFYQNDTKCTFGTCLNLGINTGEEFLNESRGLTPTIAWDITKHVTYKVEGGVYVAGSLLNWIIDKVKLASNVDELSNIAEGVNTSKSLFFVPAFVGLASPHWDMTARGLIIGLSFNHSKDHIIRAAFDSIAYQTNDVLSAARENLGISINRIKVDGGMAKNDFLMQLVANLAYCTVERPLYLESTSLGVAYLAGITSKIWSGFEEITSLRKIEKVFEPKIREESRFELIENWTKALEKSKGWIV